MSYENHHQPETEIVDFAALHLLLAPQLHFYEHPLSDELEKALMEVPAPYSESDVLAATNDVLTEHAETTADSRHPKIAAEIIDGFPAQFLDDPLITPRQYIRSHNINPNRRHLLTQAKTATLKTGAAELQQAMDTDVAEYQEYKHGISEQELLHDIPAVVADVNSRLQELASEVQTVIPDRMIAMKSTVQRMLKDHGLPADHFIMDMGVTGANYANLNRALDELVQMIKGIAAGPDVFVDGLITKHATQVEKTINDYIGNRFERLAKLAANTSLPMALNTAYAKAAGMEYSYVSENQRLREASAMPEVTLTLNPQPEAVSSSNEVVIESIGTIPSPFPWQRDVDVDIQLVSSGNENILFAIAFTPAAESISRSLRREPAVAEALDLRLKNLLGIELTDQNGSHHKIHRLSGAVGEDFEGLNINKYGNVGANAKRIYYVKTQADRFASIAELANDYGISPITPVLVFIGETDKSNQFKMLTSFGVPSAYVRNKGIK